MSISWKRDEKILKVWFEDERIYIHTDKGNTLSLDLEVFPTLKDATPDQRNAVVIEPWGEDSKQGPHEKNQVRASSARTRSRRSDCFVIFGFSLIVHLCDFGDLAAFNHQFSFVINPCSTCTAIIINI